MSGPCGGLNTKTGVSMLPFESEVDGISLFTTNLCFEGFQNIKDTIFPENSLRIRVGFNDNKGNYYSYPARIGGIANDGKIVKTGYCEREDDNSFKCSALSQSEFLGVLEKNTILTSDIVFADNPSWANFIRTATVAELLAQLKKAIRTGDNFPVIQENDNFVLQILMIRKDK